MLTNRSSLLLLAALISSAPAFCEIVVDDTITSRRTLNGPNYLISHDLGRVAGVNLFHSFSQFNLDMNESAIFTGPDSVKNILSRVTEEKSTINGCIRSSIAGANFYFINPFGIIFGPGASIDVDGAISIAAADYIRLADGARFDAFAPNASSFSTAPPEAFGFLELTNKQIVIEGSLIESAGKTVAIAAAGVEITNSRLTADDGAIRITGIQKTGDMRLADGHMQSSVPVQEPVETGKIVLHGTSIALINDSRLAISGGRLHVDESSISAATTAGSVETMIDLRATGSVEMTGSVVDMRLSAAQGSGLIQLAGETVIVRKGSKIEIATSESVADATIRIDGERIVVDGAGSDFFSGIVSTSNDDNSHDVGGNIEIRGGNLVIANAAAISTTAAGKGQAGAVIIDADTVELDGNGNSFSTGIFSIADGMNASGDGGIVKIQSRDIVIAGGAQINTGTFNAGRGGDIMIGAETLSIDRNDGPLATGIFSQTQSDAAASASGSLDIRVERLNILNGAAIDVTSFGAGDAGQIFIDAGEIVLDGRGSPSFTAISAATVSRSNAGNGGMIELRYRSMSITDGGLVSTNTHGAGDAGDVRLFGGQLLIDGGHSLLRTGITAETINPSNGGNGGEIDISGEVVSIRDGGIVSTTTGGSGNAGNINVVSERIVIDGDNAFPITGVFSVTLSESNGGNGAQIRVSADNLTMIDSGLISTTSGGSGNAGTITIESGSVELRRGSMIESSSHGTGDGGSILMSVHGDLTALAGIITTASAQSNTGVIHMDVGGRLELKESRITGSTTVNGGDIEISAVGIGYFRNSRITALAGANGGSIRVDTRRMALNSSRVAADAVIGDGGNIALDADVLIRSTDSSITASSELGLSGIIDIAGPEHNLAGSLHELPYSLSMPEVQLHDQCAVFFEDNISTFTIGGRGGMSPDMDDLMPILPLIQELLPPPSDEPVPHVPPETKQ